MIVDHMSSLCLQYVVVTVCVKAGIETSAWTLVSIYAPFTQVPLCHPLKWSPSWELNDDIIFFLSQL